MVIVLVVLVVVVVEVDASDAWDVVVGELVGGELVEVVACPSHIIEFVGRTCMSSPNTEKSTCCP